MAAEITTDERGKPVVKGAFTGRFRPATGVELWWWMFMRLSGILLLFLAVGHVLIMHYLGDGIERVDFGFVAARWQNPVWRVWDWLLLSLALIHGVNGLRVIVGDYVHKPPVRVALNYFSYALTLLIFAIGTVVVFTFDPTKWGPVG